MASVKTQLVEYPVKSVWLHTSVTWFQSCDRVFGICDCQIATVADFCQAVTVLEICISPDPQVEYSTLLDLLSEKRKARNTFDYF